MAPRRLKENPKVLVTGSGGVLGAAVLKQLKQNGFHNVIAPRRSELDLLDVNRTFDFIGSHRPDAVIHLASVVFGLAGNMKYQMMSIEQNTLLNNNLFSALYKFPAEYVFFAGTVASYPHPYASMPLQEERFFDGLPHRGEFGYASAKRHAYNYLSLLKSEAGVEFTYGIFTNLYGEADRFDVAHGHVIPSLIAKAHASKKDGVLEVWGDGFALRDFLNSEDAAQAVVLCLKSDTPDLVNISSGVAVSIREVAETVARIAGIQNVVFQTDMPVGIPRRVVDNSRLRALGFVPRVGLSNGLLTTYEWYTENLAEARK